MKKLLLTLNLFCCFAIGWSQNQSVILAPNYVPDITNLTLPIPLPTFGIQGNGNFVEGYEGQTPQAAKNIIVDNQGKIVFFIIDQHIYDRKGKLIDVFEFTINFGNLTHAIGLVSEIAVIPVPNDCNSYYLVSTGENLDAGVSFAKGYYARLKVVYDSQDNMLPESGLQLFSSDDCEAVAQSFENIIGSAFYADNNWHDERPLIAATSMNVLGNQFLFIANGTRIFKLNITENGITYSGNFVNLLNIFPGNNIDPVNFGLREEMEVISYQGGYRLALPIRSYYPATGAKFRDVAILDFNSSGVFIPTSQKLVSYIYNPTSQGDIYLKGIELSKDGSKLYVAHNKYNQYTSTLDMFDLNTTPIVKTMVSSFVGFENSQIESTFDVKAPIDPNQCTMLIPYAGTIAAITNANSPSFISNLDLNYSYLNVNIPATVPYSPSTNAGLVRLMQDQIDYADYSVIDPNYYNRDIYESVSSAIWQDNAVSGGSNPLVVGIGNTIYIKKELRIKAGHTITIKNMNIHFAPEARLVIENGGSQGGKLILDGTILTMDNRCESNEMWLGVEVWGNQTLTQGSFNNSNQGRLELKNNSIIEHAHIGTLVGKRQPKLIEICPGVFEETYLPYTFDNQRTGGIVQSTNSFYFGNQRGVWFQPYISGTSNNLSVFTNTEFKWNGPLIEQNLYFHAHAQLEEVFGVRFLGSDFINHDVGAQSNVGPSGQGDGYGIVAQNSQFYVDARCATAGITPVGTPCANLDRCKFLNLFMGISTSNSDTRTFRCDKNDFINCRYGIYVRGTKKERISRNNFFVREAFYQCAGLAMYNSSEYTVQENAFDILNNTSFTDSDAISYGIVVNSSGIANNDIYKNTFKNLMIGGQAEKQNAQLINTLNNPETTPFMMSGLTWTCNNFVSNVRKHDLTVVGGNIDYWQGFPNLHNNNLEGIQNSARNTFSLVGEPFINAHDIAQFSGQKILYTHLNQANHTPDSFTDFMVQPHLIIGAGNMPISPIGNTCPSKLDVKPIKLKSDLIVKRTELKNHKDRMSGGVSAELLSMILTENNPNTIKSELLTKSPFLSDEVLLAYLNSSASSSMKKEVLLANTKLSQSILDAVSNSNLPNGTKNQIYAAQNSESLKSSYYLTLSRLEGEYDYLYNDLLSQTMLNSEDTTIIQSTIDLTSELGDIESKKLKVHALINKGELQLAENLRQELILELGNDDNLELIRIHKDIRPIQATVVAIENQPSLGQELENIRDFSIDGQVRKRAAYLLELRDGITEVPLFLPLINSSAMEINSNEVNEVANNLELLKVISMYPNPSTGEVFFDFPELNEGILSIKLMDVNGKEIYSYISESKSNGERVDLSHIKKGFYLVQINIDGAFLEMQKLLLK